MYVYIYNVNLYIYTCMFKCIYTHICDLRIPESQMTHCAPINFLVVIIHNQSRAIPLWLFQGGACIWLWTFCPDP